jgi:formiminoglutamase
VGDVVKRWRGGELNLRFGQPVLVGFPCDEGVKRNHGRVGAALGPNAIRAQLYRMTTWDRLAEAELAEFPPIDLGNVRCTGTLEESQENLSIVVKELLAAGAVPIVLGGGHETAYGHFLGYVKAEIELAVINLDAHLDVRPFEHGGHSGSPFRQMFHHRSRPLKDGRYVVIGAQRQSVALAHYEFLQQRGGRIYWYDMQDAPKTVLRAVMDEIRQVSLNSVPVLLSVDADAFRQADVPGVSAPNAAGFSGILWPEIAFIAGMDRRVRSLELVEVNPNFDRDDQTARWAALGIRQFLVGLTRRGT